MKTKAAYLALFAECLTLPAVLWIFTVTLFLKEAQAPVPEMIWTLMMAAVTYLTYMILLRRPRTIPVIAGVSTALFAVQIVLYILLYTGDVYFGFILAVLLLSAVTAYASLYYCLKEPVVVKHLFFLDVMILALVWMMLFISVIEVSLFSVICSIAVVFLNVGGLIALRMSEDGESEGIAKAFVLAAGSAAVLAVIIYLLVRLFSRSGKVTGAFLNGIRNFFLLIWRGIEAFAGWLATLIDPAEGAAAPEMAPAMGVGGENEVVESIPVNPVTIAVIIGVIIAVAAILIVIRFRKNKMKITLGSIGGAADPDVRRKKRKSESFFSRLLTKFAFIKNAFIYRNTPRGVLVWLERWAKKKKAPRQTSESVREFIFRLAPEGGLSALADDLDGIFYAGKPAGLSGNECRKLKKQFRNRNRQSNKKTAETAA